MGLCLFQVPFHISFSEQKTAQQIQRKPQDPRPCKNNDQITAESKATYRTGQQATEFNK
jgi:hypothetical protein